MNGYFEEIKADRKDCTEGDIIAYQAYEDTVSDIYTEGRKMAQNGNLVVRNLPWERNVSDFISAMRKADVECLSIIDNTTNLLKILGMFINEENCEIVGMVTVERKLFQGVTEPFDGIKIRINGGKK